jgi:hypothetical protein
VKGSNGLSTADEVTIFSATGPNVYWYYDGSEGGAEGWYTTAFQPAGSVAIPPGSSILVNRKAPGVAFNWPVPSPASF